MYTELRQSAGDIATARRYVKAMKQLDVKSVRLVAEGTWTCGSELVFARQTCIVSLGRSNVVATVDGCQTRMMPYNAGECAAQIIVIGEF